MKGGGGEGIEKDFFHRIREYRLLSQRKKAVVIFKPETSNHSLKLAFRYMYPFRVCWTVFIFQKNRTEIIVVIFCTRVKFYSLFNIYSSVCMSLVLTMNTVCECETGEMCKAMTIFTNAPLYNINKR